MQDTEYHVLKWFFADIFNFMIDRHRIATSVNGLEPMYQMISLAVFKQIRYRYQPVIYSIERLFDRTG